VTDGQMVALAFLLGIAYWPAIKQSQRLGQYLAKKIEAKWGPPTE
jgi:hypothetical protein